MGSFMKWTTSWARAPSNVESAKGSALGGGLPDINARVPLPSGIDERFGRVYGRDATGPDPLDQLTHEGARAAADIEHPQSGVRFGRGRQAAASKPRE